MVKGIRMVLVRISGALTAVLLLIAAPRGCGFPCFIASPCNNSSVTFQCKIVEFSCRYCGDILKARRNTELTVIFYERCNGLSSPGNNCTIILQGKVMPIPCGDGCNMVQSFRDITLAIGIVPPCKNGSIFSQRENVGVSCR